MPRHVNKTSFKKGQKTLPDGKPMGWKPKGFVPWNKGKRQWPNGLPESIKSKCGLASKGRQNYWLWKKVTRNCEWCGKSFSGQAARMQSRRFCSYTCSANSKAQHKPRNSYAYYHRISTRTMKLQGKMKQCKICGIDKDLVVHHDNGDHSNNTLENLVVLCRSCHSRFHLTTRRQLLNV